MMKMKAELVAVVIGSMAILNVEAATSVPMDSAAATFDRNKFAVTAYPIGPNLAPAINWSNQSSSVSAQTDTDNQNGSADYTYQDAFTNSPIHSKGALNLAFLVNDGESYHLSAGNSSNANATSIPLPSAVWLFMSALLGVLSLTRRK
jgi:hypothetical protein